VALNEEINPNWGWFLGEVVSVQPDGDGMVQCWIHNTYTNAKSLERQEFKRAYIDTNDGKKLFTNRAMKAKRYEKWLVNVLPDSITRLRNFSKVGKGDKYLPPTICEGFRKIAATLFGEKRDGD
jgi:hypothetical protein